MFQNSKQFEIYFQNMICVFMLAYSYVCLCFVFYCDDRVL